MKLCALLLALVLLLPGSSTNPDNIKGNAFGNPGAPLLIEVFSDFECPACKRLHDEEMPLLMKDFVTAGKAYLVYRYFAWPQHAHARQAADLVCAAAQLGKWEPAANALFAKQQIWSINGQVEETVNAVLTPSEQKKLKSLVNDPAVKAQVDRDLQLAQMVPVQSTPSILVTYRLKRYPIEGQGVFSYSLVKSFLDDLLKK
jgi:protein-disulfide isomerase